MNAAAVDRDEVIDVDGEAARVIVPANAIVALTSVAADDRVAVTDRSMTNRHLAVRWDSNGNVTSVIAIDAAR